MATNMMSSSVSLKTSCPTAVKFSPFSRNHLACTSAENFGLHGKGYGHLLELGANGSISVSTQFMWSDSLLDLSWSEAEPEFLVTGAGDGTIQLWNIRQPHSAVQVYAGHHKEIYSIQWNQTRTGHNFLSGSWDQTAKLWDVHRTSYLQSYENHCHYVYDVGWSPHMKDVFASVSGDGYLRLWNIFNTVPTQVIPAHNAEILSCSWNKYNPYVIATGATDSLIRVWDIRNPSLPTIELKGHRYAVRRVCFSPHNENLLVSSSYDFSTRIWSLKTDRAMTCDVFDHHSEFVYGLDLSVLTPGLIADCSWDKSIRLIYVPV